MKEMRATRVVHYKKEKCDVYIGRPSKWGNPFEIGRDGSREEVIQKYREWVKGQPRLMGALGELKGKVLGCWCSPKPCHGDVLAELAEKEGKLMKIDYDKDFWLIVDKPEENLLVVRQMVTRIQMEQYQGNRYLPQVNMELHLAEHPVPDGFRRILQKDFGDDGDSFVGLEAYFVKAGSWRFEPKLESA